MVDSSLSASSFSSLYGMVDVWILEQALVRVVAASINMFIGFRMGEFWVCFMNSTVSDILSAPVDGMYTLKNL